MFSKLSMSFFSFFFTIPCHGFHPGLEHAAFWFQSPVPKLQHCPAVSAGLTHSPIRTAHRHTLGLGGRPLPAACCTAPCGASRTEEGTTGAGTSRRRPIGASDRSCTSHDPGSAPGSSAQRDAQLRLTRRESSGERERERTALGHLTVPAGFRNLPRSEFWA